MSDISKIFNNICDYKFINKLNDKKLRCRRNGINIGHALLYRFSYCDINSTKQYITNSINYEHTTNFYRQSYDQKEDNISVNIYEYIFKNIVKYYEDNCSLKNIINNKNKYTYVAVDGTYSNDINKDEILNLGFYDVCNNIPIDIVSCSKNKNGEVKQTINYIKKNLNKLDKKIVFVGDRCYYSYELLNFLQENNFKFIIRTKGNGDSFDKNKLNNNLKNNIRIVRCNYESTKVVVAGTGKKNLKKAIVKTNNNSSFITNLDENITEKNIINIYKSRWNIETYFKYVKNNFKFQHSNEKINTDSLRKNYICEMIITYIVKIIDIYYWNNITHKVNKRGYSQKINNTLLTRGIFDYLLKDIFDNKLTDETFKNFCMTHCKLIVNEKNRSFPRNSKTAFSKWYIKGYSEITKYGQIYYAIKNNTVDKLNKNLKLTAKKIIEIILCK
jgi:hypothetical protein